MTQNDKKNKPIKKRKKSKYLMRRIAIVSVCLLLVWLVILLVNKGLNDDKAPTEQGGTNHDSAEITEDSISTEVPLSTVGTDLTEQTGSEETTENLIDSAETHASTDSSVEIKESESIQILTESTTVSTTQATTKSTTESTTEEGDANMDFTEVSYYIGALDARYQAYFNTHKAKSTSEIVRDVNMNLDYDFYGHIEKVDNPNALSVICNKYYQLPSNFTPENLKSVPEGYFVSDGKTYQLKQNALDAFISMSDAAKEEGLSLRIISAYRTNSYQANLYQKYKNNNGQTAADRFSARPGHSEHETGLAIDINDVAQAFENTEEFSWLEDNAHKYGYVLRYPAGMENVTGYMYEPWHYRYLGDEVATQLKNLGLTYDAYYAMYLLK